MTRDDSVLERVSPLLFPGVFELRSPVTAAQEYAFLTRFRDGLIEDLHAVTAQVGMDKRRCVAIGKKEANGFTAPERESAIFDLDFSGFGKPEIGGDAFEAGAILFNLELDCAIAGFDAQIEKECEEPIASKRIIVTGQNFLHTALVVGAGSKIGAEQKPIRRANETGELRENEAWFGIGDYAKESVEPWPVSRRHLVQDCGEAGSILQITNQANAIIARKERQRCLTGLKNQGKAEIDRSERRAESPIQEQAQQVSLLFTVAAAESDDLDLFARWGESTDCVFQRTLIGGSAIFVPMRRRAGLMKLQPFCCLLDALVMEPGVDVTPAQAIEQFSPDILRELALVNEHESGRSCRGNEVPDFGFCLLHSNSELASAAWSPSKTAMFATGPYLLTCGLISTLPRTLRVRNFSNASAVRSRGKTESMTGFSLPCAAHCSVVSRSARFRP